MADLNSFLPRQQPSNVKLEGKYALLRSIDWAEHGPSLATHIAGPNSSHLWTYIPFGPLEGLSELETTMCHIAKLRNWETLAILSKRTGEALGTASYMRQRPEHGSVEVGCIIFSGALQKTRAATEAMYLMASHVFDDLGYRRYEWKCDNENTASKRAAERFGFTYEGTFRQDMVVKGKNRNTAWFSMTDKEWPHIKTAFEAWLAPENFSDTGAQLQSLHAYRQR